MDNRRNSASYSSRHRNSQGPLPDYQPSSSKNQQSSGYFARAPRAEESPVIPDYAPQNTARQRAAPSANNGLSSGGSQRRRDSQEYASRAVRPVDLPSAPDAPRPVPSTSNRHQYPNENPGSHPPGSGLASYPARARAAKESMRNPAEEPYGALSAQTPQSTDPVRRSSQTDKRGSVSDRSPLQRLEVKLDDISKEEKRARLEEAEMLAEERAAAARAARANRAVSADARQSRRMSAMDADKKVPMRSNSSRHTSVPVTASDAAPIDLSPPWDPSAKPIARSTSQRQPAPSSNPANQNRVGQSAVNRSVSLRDRDVPGRSRPESDAHKPQNVNRNNGMRGLGLSGIGDQDWTLDPQKTANVGRQDSRRVSIQPEEDTGGAGRNRGLSNIPAGKQQLHDRMGRDFGIAAAQEHMQPDPLPRESVRNTWEDVPKYEIPPQSAAGQLARDQIGFSAKDPEITASTNLEKSHGSHSLHLSDMLHRHRDPVRRYQAPKLLDEWKRAELASLFAKDLDLEAAVEGTDKDKAWWETSGSRRRRSTSSRNTAQHPRYDGAFEDSNGQTVFNPQLYLKCGPLLSYKGIRKAQTSSRRNVEMWRGTILIVTNDAQSSYTSRPVLRIFKQPMDILPPPPARLDTSSGQQLDPEYVDPLAGQIKSSRTGKTLYARPVHELDEEVDLSRVENDSGLFEEKKSAPYGSDHNDMTEKPSTRLKAVDGEKLGKFKEVRGIRLHAERRVTFWRFSVEIELGAEQARIAYRINRGPAIGFWVPAKGETMNMMFYSCNGFSMGMNTNQFCGPDPLWRDVLNTHQTRPFHVMIGGGDQIYNDAATRDTTLFREWTTAKNPAHKHSEPFSPEMQDELEVFYLNRYSMWFSQGLYGMATSQIPMVNLWDDHDIIDGFGSYPHHFMSTPVFTGIGSVAYKYYMLFQQQSVPDETEKEEPSWILGGAPGPYINELSRNIFLSLGRNVAFLGLDCRTERMRDEILSEKTYDLIFERVWREIVKGQTRHLVVLLGVPIAYPRLNFLENILTSRVMDPVKAMGRAGMLGDFLNKFDGGVEILDDLDDHWTAKHHKDERNWFIQELQELAAEKSVRVTILGGDVHLGAFGQFYSNKKLRLPKDRDHRYMPNIISSAIVNGPPPDIMADILNRRNKTHHLDEDTDENMIPMFTQDVDGKPRNNKHLLPRRNWCSIREYVPGSTPPPTPPETPERETSPTGQAPSRSGTLTRRLSNRLPAPLIRRLSRSGPPPAAFDNFSRESQGGGRRSSSISTGPTAVSQEPARPNAFHRRPTGLSEKGVLRKTDKARDRDGHINLEHGLDIALNVEVSQRDPAGITTPYRLLVPALDYTGEPDVNTAKRKSALSSLTQSLKDSFTKHDRSAEAVVHQQPHDRLGPHTHAGLTRANTTGNMRGIDEPALGHHEPEPERQSRAVSGPAPMYEERGRHTDQDAKYTAPPSRRETVAYMGSGQYGYDDDDDGTRDEDSMSGEYKEVHPKRRESWKFWKK